MAKTPAGFDDLVTQVKMTNRLLVLQLRERVGQKELIKVLMTTGATDQELADILGTSLSTVSVTKVRLRKERRAPKAAATNANRKG